MRRSAHARLAAAALIAALAALLAPAAALAQATCSPITQGPASWSGIVNSYYPGSGTAPAGSTSIGVGAIDARGAATPIAAGDLLLIVQVQDASISSSNSTAYGGSGSGQGYTSLNSAGQFEYAVAAGAAGGSVPLATPLVNTYHTGSANASDGQKRYQVIRVAQASSATLTGTLTAPPWNGSTGGIVAVDTAGNLNFNGQVIDVDGRGFRGGGGQSSTTDGTGAPTNANTDYVSNIGAGTLGSSVPNGAKGEGVAGTPIIVFTQTTPNSSAAGSLTNTGGTDGTSGGYPGGSFGRGAPGNGGGGGTDGDSPANDQNTGGAGGGNYGIGGKGGFGWTPGTPPGWDGGGMGGMSVPGGTKRLFFGGGGGAGSSNNATGNPGAGLASSGASGGGMVFVRAGTTSGGGTINARGTSANTSVGNDASGGGGAGGSALVFVNNNGAAVGPGINIQGGNGGCNTGGGTSTGTCTVPTGGSPHGPGGGGSGGFALLSGTATVNSAGGSNGVTATSTTSTQDYGSTSSSGGFQIVALTANQIPGSGGQGSCFPQLTVTKSTSTPFVAAGAPATYTITVANAANKSTATGVSLSDVLPANPNMTYASNGAIVLGGGATRTAVADPAAAATSPSWGTFSIPGGGSVALTFVANTALATAPAVYQNPATVTYLDPTRTASQTVTPGGTYLAGGTVAGSNYNSASSTAEDVTIIPAPTVTKSFNPQAVAVGATSTLTVAIANPGTTTLTGAGLVDNYPAGMVNAAAPGGATTCGGSVTAAPGGTSFTLTGATIPSSGACAVTVNVKITASGAYVNTIPAGALTDAQNVSNPAAGSAALYTDVTVAKSFNPNAVAPNASSTVSLVLTNPNTTAVTLANPGLTDSFPANLVAAGGAVTVTGTGCTGYAPTTLAANAIGLALTAGTIPAGASCTVSFAVKSATTGIYANTTTGVTTVETGATGPVSNTANLGVGVINIAKAFAPANIVSGGTSTLTFTLSNPTGVAQTAGAFTDTLTNMSVAANQNTGGTCAPVTALTAGQTALSFGGLNVPAAGCTITLTVTSSTVGAQNNTSGGVITALLPRGPSSNTATLNVLAKPTIAKAFAPATILPGATSTLTFTITNPGPVGLTGMSFTDTYGAGLVNATPLVVGGSCTGVATTATAGGTTFNVTAGAIPASASCSITVQVTAAAVGSYANTASGVATTDTGAAGTGSNTATLSVANPPTIAKAFATPTIGQGGTSVATFTLTNGNTIPLTNLNFTDALTSMSVASPATIGGTCVGTTNSPSLVAGATALNLTVPSLAAGASCTVTVTLTASVSGTWSNTASGVTSTQTPSAGTASNTATLTVLAPPALAKAFVPSAIQTGATSVMTFTLTNPNASNALTNVSFTDALVNMSVSGTQAPGGTCTGITPASITNGATSLTLGSSSLAAGATCTITVVVTSSVMSAATGHPNTTGTVSATEAAVNPGAAATGNLVVWAPPTITKAFAPNSIATNGTTTVTFTLTNPNPGGLTNIRFTDDIPTNTSNTAAQTFIGGARGTCTGTIPTSKVAGVVDPITFSSTNLAAGASCTIMMDMTSGTAGSYTNTVTNILSDQTPTATTGGSDVLTVGRVAITKAFSAATVQTNGTATLTFTITNGSGGNRTGLTFTDNFPAGMVAVGGTVTTGGTCTSLAPTTVAANATSYNLTALNLNNNITCTISFPVKITSAGAKSNTVTGTAPAQFTGSTDTATITAFDAPTIAKAFAPATIMAGDTSTLTFTLANPNGFAALTGAGFTDTLANMAVSGAQAVGGTCGGTTPSSLANGATALAFTGITIPSGGSCTVTVLVTSPAVGVQPNTASGVTTTQTPTAGAGTGTVNLTVAGINLSKAFNPTARPVGVASTLTFTLASTQSVAWSGLAFTDTLQTGLVVASPSNATTTCGSGTITAAPGSAAITLAGATMAAGASPCTVSVDVVSAATGTYTNNGSNLSATSPGVAFSGAAATVQYFGAATLTKAFGTGSVAAGATTTLTFTLTNPAGAQAVSGLGFTDTFPAGLVVAAAPGASNTCGATWAPGAGAASVTLSGGALGAGPASCIATVNVTAATLGNYVNNASNVGALAGGLTAAGVNASLAVVGTSLAKQFNPLVVGPNATSTLTFTIANGTGNPAQSGLAFTDTLPVNLVVATPPGTANGCGGAVTAAVGSGSIALAGGTLAAAQASCTVSVNVTSAQPGVYVNAAGNISGTSATLDASGVNATLTVLTTPTAAKGFGAALIAPGGSTSLTLTFANVNSAAVTGLAFTDTFPTTPGAMTLASTTSTNTCGGTLTNGAGGALTVGDGAIRLAGGTIPANGSCAVTVSITAPTAGAYTNVIPASGITSANAGSIASATSATVTVLAVPVIAKSFAGPIGPGRTATLTFTLTNPNAGTALSGVAFADTFPTAPAAMVVAAAPNATTSGCGAPTFAPAGSAASVAFSAGTIAASGTCTVAVDVTVPSVGTYNNTTGTITATGPVVLTGGTASGSLTVVQPTLAKAFAPATVDVGQVSTLTFTLANGAGNPAQSGINFTDTLPVGVVTVAPLNITSTCPSGAGAVSSVAGSGTITVTNATMSVGQASCTINVDVQSAAAGTYTNASANLTGVAHVDTSTASGTLTVRAQPALTKAFGAATVGIGQVTTLVFTVDNTGTNAVARAGLSFTDALPAGITIANPPVPTASASCGTPTFTAANGTQPFTASAISVGAAQTCTITLTVRGAALGAAVNGAAQITAISGMANGVTGQTLTVVQPTAAKTFAAASINDNATTSLVFTLANGAGNPAQGGIVLGDTLPASLRFNSATPAVAYSAGCSGPATATYTAATRVLSGLTGIAITAGTASCTVTVAGVTNVATQTNASCAGNPAAFTNLVANVTATNATPAGSDQCLVVSAIAPNAAKTFGAASINDGAATTLVFTLTNQGSNPAQSGIALGDALPTGLAINSATPAVAYSAGCSGPATATYTAATRVLSGLTGIAMTAGTASCTVTVAGVTNQATQINASCAGNPAAFTNAVASVTTTNATNTSSAQCLVVNRVSPTVAKTFGAGSFADGAATTLVFTLANQGTHPAQSAITLGDTLPSGLAISSATPAVAYSAGCSGPANATYTAATHVLSGLTGIAMANGTASCTVTVSGLTNTATQVNASCPSAAFTNLAANVTATNATPGGADQCVVVTRANPTVAKTFGAASINDTAATTLVFTLTNSGTSPAQSAIAVGDTLPAGLRLNSATPAVAYSAGCSGPATASYTAATRVLAGLSGIAMSAGTASCTVTVAGLTNAAGQVSASCAGNPAAFTNLAASVTATNATPAGSDQCLVVNVQSPNVAKTFGAGTIADGAATTLVFTVTNQGSNPAQSGIGIGDTLPAGLALNSATPAVAYSAGCSGPANAAYNAGTRVLSGLSGIAIANGTASCTVTVAGLTNAAAQVNASCPAAAFTNAAASVTTTAANNTSVDQCLVVTRTNASLAKVFAPSTIDAGGTSTLVFTITNSGTNPAQTGINFTDTLPVGVALAGAPNVQSNCPAGGAEVNNPAFVATAAGLITVTGAALNPGVASCDVRVNVTAPAAGTFNNTNAANISGAANVATAGVNATLTVQALPTITKAFGAASIGIGQVTTLAFTLDNTAGPVSRPGLSFSDALPAGIEVANPPAATTSAGCQAPTLTGTANASTTIGASSVGVNAGQACVITFTVRGTSLGAKTNNAASMTVGGLANAVTPQTVTVVQASLDKVFSPASIAAGGTSTLTFTLTNGAGNPAQSGIGLTDTLPGNVRVAATPNVQTNCPAGAGFAAPAFTVTAAGGTGSIAVSGAAMNGAVASCQVRVDVTAAIGGAYTNDSTNISVPVNVTNAVAGTTLTVNTVAPSVAKQFTPATVNANAPSTLTITLANGNASVASLTAAFTDAFPAPVVVAPTPNAATTCAGSGAVVAAAGSGSVTLPATRSIPAAVGATPGSCTITVDVVSPVGGTFTNTIAANALQTSNGNNAAASASLTVNAAAPTIAKQFAPATIAADGTSTVTLTIASANATALTGASFTDTLSAMSISGAQVAGGTCAGAGANNLTNGQTAITIAGLTIPAAVGATPGSCTVTFVVTSDVPGPHGNQASGVASAQAPTGAASNVATLTVNAAAPTLAKAFAPASIAYGATSTITFTISNTNGVPLTAAAFGDTLANMSVAGAQAAGGTCAGVAGNSYANGQTGLLNFAGLTIPANASCTVTLVVTSTAAGAWPNQASGVASNEAPTGAASNTATLTVTATSLTVSKTFTPATINSGDVTTLAITVTNPNGAAVTGLALTDAFPTAPGTGLVRAATPNASTTCTSGTVTSTAGSVTLSGATLAAGASCTFQVDVTAATAGTYTNTIPAGAITSSAGSNAVAATKSLTVNPLANLAVTKLGPASIATGAPISYTITVSNAGPDAANGATFGDNVPAAITGVSAVCAGAAGGAACGAMNVSGNAVTSTIPTLPAGGSVSITVSGTASGVGSVTNTATVTSPAGVPDPVAVNNTSSVTTNILAPDLTITKTHGGSFTVGTNGTYTITVSNTPGSLATSGTITVTDALPTGLGFVSAAGTGWACGFAAGTVTCTTSSSLAAGTAAPAITLTVSVASTAVPSVTNFATVSGGGEPAATTGNDTASDNTIVVAGGVNVFQPDGAQTGMPGTVVSYPHTFNAGLAGTVSFSTSAVAIPAVPGWTQTIYRDTDCNGVINGAEGSAPLTGPIAVNAGDVVCIVVRDSIPATAPYNAQNAISVNATFNGSQVITRHDTTTVGSAAGAGLVLAKSVRNVTLGTGAGTANTARPGDVLEYTITYTNTSSGTVNAIVITDATPAFTTYLSASCGAPLPATLTGCAVTAQPAVNGAGSVVWTLGGSLLSNGSGAVLYQVKVAP